MSCGNTKPDQGHGDLSPGREQVLVLLYDENVQHEEALRQAVEYKNVTNFRTVLRQLHGMRLIEFRADRNASLHQRELSRPKLSYGSANTLPDAG